MTAAVAALLDEGVCPLTTRDLAGGILQFCEAVADGELYSYQRAVAFRVIESLLNHDGAVITVLFSRQSGKSRVMGDLGIGLTIVLPALAAQYPADPRLSPLKQVMIGVFGPNQDSTGPIFERLRDLARSERVQAIVSSDDIGVQLVQDTGNQLRWSSGALVRAKTASEQAYVEGKTYHLILIDEAQKVSAYKVNKEISPMLAATNGTMVKIGTAYMSRGGFHTDISMNIAAEKAGGPRNHFEYPYDVCCKEKRATYDRQARSHAQYKQQLKEVALGQRMAVNDNVRKLPADVAHLQYEQWVNKEMARLGGGDPKRGYETEEFKMNFRLLWQESRQIALADNVILAAARPGVEARTEGQRHGVQFFGLDVAKDNDSSVLTVIEMDLSVPIIATPTLSPLSRRGEAEAPTLHYRRSVLAWIELQGAFEGDGQYAQIVRFLSMFACRRGLVDSTGIGDPVCERLQVLLAPFGIEVEPYRFSLATKSDLYKFYLEEWRSGRFTYPAGPQTRSTLEWQNFTAQHYDLTREWQGSYLRCAASTEDGHDDYPDSAGLAVWASRELGASTSTVGR